jgi:AraC-like DNA-binding protein
MTTDDFLPLDGFPYFHVRDPEPAQQMLVKSLGPLDIDPLDSKSKLDWRMNRIDAGPLTLFSGRLLGGWVIHGEPSYYLAVVSQLGHAHLVQRGGEADLRPDLACGIISPDIWSAWKVATKVGSISARIDPRFLEAQMEALTGVMLQKPLRFAPQLPTHTSAGASLSRLLRFVAGELEQDATTMNHPLIATNVCEAIVRILLLGQPHSSSHLLEKPGPGAGSRSVRAAEEYMEANAASPICMADLAKLTGSSVRSLQMAFRAHRGCSPMAFLRAKRMELARSMLLSPLPLTSVTSVAHTAGFLQLGQFSVDYRKRYGESPSQTLGRGRKLVRP